MSSRGACWGVGKVFLGRGACYIVFCILFYIKDGGYAPGGGVAPGRIFNNSMDFDGFGCNFDLAS